MPADTCAIESQHPNSTISCAVMAPKKVTVVKVVKEPEQQQLRASAKANAMQESARKRKAQSALETTRMEEENLTGQQLVESASPEGKLAAVAVAVGITGPDGDFDEQAAADRVASSSADPSRLGAPSGSEVPKPKETVAVAKSLYGFVELPIQSIKIHKKQGKDDSYYVLSLEDTVPTAKMVTTPKAYMKMDFNPEVPAYSKEDDQLLFRARMDAHTLARFKQLEDFLKDAAAADSDLAGYSWKSKNLKDYGEMLQMKALLKGRTATQIIFKQGDAPSVAVQGKEFYEQQMQNKRCVGARPTLAFKSLYIDKQSKTVSLAQPVCTQVVFKIEPCLAPAQWEDIIEDDL